MYIYLSITCIYYIYYIYIYIDTYKFTSERQSQTTPSLELGAETAKVKKYF